MIEDRKPNRLHGYDYSSDNLYYVTSCVHNRICCFGEIVPVGTGRDLSLQIDPQMVLNDYGMIAEKQWYWLSEQYPYVVVHEFVVMPNHIHGIIEINRNNIPVPVGTGRELSLRIKSLSELMGAYKTSVSKQIHLLGFIDFAWQRSFYDHIIRDEKSFERISGYIKVNPINWKQDKFR